jgi:D-alanine-D-alanine ligase-like ATP-grasp enzyme
LSGADAVIPAAPLYTKYIKKKAEFRVHIINNDQNRYLITQKVARPGAEVTNWRVRSHQNGFIFQEPAPNLPANLMGRLRILAHEFVEFLGLDFGAVDIIWNEQTDSLYALEVNTAPGITGRTVDFYRNAFESI